MILPLLLSFSAYAGDLELGYTPNLGANEKPALIAVPPRPVDELYVNCEVGGKSYEWTKKALAAGAQQRFEWPRNPAITSADCYVRVRFKDGSVEELSIPITYEYAQALSVDLSRAKADVKAHTLTVKATGYVAEAEIVAYGVGKAELARKTVPIGAGPGEITIPWAGDASEVVLLTVTLRSGSSWAAFDFSPWYLEIPHEDILFDTNSDVITKDEEWKLERTLQQLAEVQEKYGDIVPVKLYVAGCTDTVGDSAANRELSRRRAKAIANWLRAHGYDKPIYYYGYGEGYLAVPTGDGVDEVRNRRAVYLVGSSPPPSGSGVPSADWSAL